MHQRLFGIPLQSPFIIGSGPLCSDAEGIIALHRAGAGAMVTKTINLTPAINASRHIASCGQNSLLNCEAWSEYTADRWIETELPKAKAAGAVVIVSVGSSLIEQPALITELIAAGADMIEAVAYSEAELPALIQALSPHCTVPLLVKLSANYRDLLQTAKACLQAGGNGFTACDSVGPALHIDIHTGIPSLVGNGTGWLSGAMIKPIILHRVYSLREHFDCPIIGLGGIMTVQDCIEYTMAGADALSICTAAMLHGPGIIQKLISGVEQYLAKNNYKDLDEIRGLAQNRNSKEFRMDFRKEDCISCMRCVTVCCYGARALTKDKVMTVDESLCRNCGLCVSVCPRRCLDGEPALLPKSC